MALYVVRNIIHVMLRTLEEIPIMTGDKNIQNSSPYMYPSILFRNLKEILTLFLVISLSALALGGVGNVFEIHAIGENQFSVTFKLSATDFTSEAASFVEPDVIPIDRPEEGWSGNVSFVPQYLKDLGFSTDKTVLVCGPPIMIKLTLAALEQMGFNKKQVYTTMEMKMKCGIGKCGRCNIGSKYVCKDGPVFRCDELDELPDEY